MPNHQTEKRSFMVLMLLLVIGGIYLLQPFFTALILAGVLTVLFYPLHQRYLKWTKDRAGLSALLSVISVVLVLLIPLAVMLTLVTAQLASVVVPHAAQMTPDNFTNFLASLQQKITFWTAKFEYLAGIDFQLVPWMQKLMGTLAQTVARYSPKVIAETANFGLHFFVMIIVLFYLFRDGRVFLNHLISISPVKDQYEHRLAKEIKVTIDGVFYGNFLTGLVQAILATIGYYFAGIDGYFVWGAITFFMSFIPMLGTGVVLIPLVLMLFIQGHTTKAVFLTIYGAVVIGSSDNLLRPLLTRSNMHSLVVFLSIFGGLAVFGPLGLLVGPIIMAMLTATVRIYARDFK
jgi:Predicted permease